MTAALLFSHPAKTVAFALASAASLSTSYVLAFAQASTDAIPGGDLTLVGILVAAVGTLFKLLIDSKNKQIEALTKENERLRTELGQRVDQLIPRGG